MLVVRQTPEATGSLIHSVPASPREELFPKSVASSIAGEPIEHPDDEPLLRHAMHIANVRVYSRRSAFASRAMAQLLLSLSRCASSPFVLLLVALVHVNSNLVLAPAFPLFHSARARTMARPKSRGWMVAQDKMNMGSLPPATPATPATEVQGGGFYLTQMDTTGGAGASDGAVPEVDPALEELYVAKRDPSSPTKAEAWDGPPEYVQPEPTTEELLSPRKVVKKSLHQRLEEVDGFRGVTVGAGVRVVFRDDRLVLPAPPGSKPDPLDTPGVKFLGFAPSREQRGWEWEPELVQRHHEARVEAKEIMKQARVMAMALAWRENARKRIAAKARAAEGLDKAPSPRATHRTSYVWLRWEGGMLSR